MPPPRTVALVRHPAAAAPAGLTITVSVTPLSDGGLYLAYRLAGPLNRLRIPTPVPAGPADGLWLHTCFEAFVSAPGSAAYREFNFSPDGRWAAYAFTACRQKDEAFAPAAAPAVAVQASADGLAMEARLDPALLPAAALDIGLTAVLEAADGSKSYWALVHPGPQPDFHQRAGFALHLTRPRPATDCPTHAPSLPDRP